MAHTEVFVQGSESVYGRDLVEEHLDACIQAGLTISGINAEVMPGQWEFQIGPAGPLDMPDEVCSKAHYRHGVVSKSGILTNA